jgi:DHA1 family tetracycline resistance protein-like MFS transporter
MFGFSKTGILFWLGIPFLNLTSFTWPAAQSILSRKTSASEQGQLQGAINSLRGIAGLVGPSFFTYSFSRSIGADAILHLPGAPFYTAAAMLFLALLLSQHAAAAPQPAHGFNSTHPFSPRLTKIQPACPRNLV